MITYRVMKVTACVVVVVCGDASCDDVPPGDNVICDVAKCSWVMFDGAKRSAVICDLANGIPSLEDCPF